MPGIPILRAGAFFDRAIREARRYGDDPWIFLRELVQNSRDAGATHIYCHTEINDVWTYLDFQDNGEGMSESDFERYLLRLYASSKEENQEAIGFYGVGFWSTLLFEPKLIRLVSRCKGKTIGYEIDCEKQAVQPIEAKLKHDGTRITLIRPTHSEDGNLADLIYAKLITYTGPVRPAPGRDILNLVCNGERINRPFEIPPHFGRTIRGREFDGVIGLGHQPWVKLYKGGILVRDLTSLEEVLPNRSSQLPAAGLGLYPQIAINADGLTVLMDRQSVFEDPLLQQIVQVCEDHLIQSQRQMVQQLFPMNWRNRLLHWRQKLKLKHLIGLPITLALLMTAIWLGRELWGNAVGESIAANPPQPAKGYVDTAFQKWRGPEIDYPTANAIQWQFQYDGGPAYLLFRMATFSRFDLMRGWLPDENRPDGSYLSAEGNQSDTPISIRMATAQKNAYLILPVPPKYRLVTRSVVTSSGEQPNVYRNSLDEPLVFFSETQQLSYQVVPQSAAPPRSPFLAALSISDYPADFVQLFQRIEGSTPSEKSKKIAQFLNTRFHYTRSPQAADRFQRSSGNFIQRLQTVGSGDCDLLNGVYTLMLQTAGIPAYLSVGLVGRQGLVQSNLHAWVRFWVDGHWVTADIIAPQHLHILRPNQAFPAGPPANLDQTPEIDGVRPKISSEATISVEDRQVPNSEKKVRFEPQSKSKVALLLLIGLLTISLGTLIWFWRQRPKRHPKVDRPHYLANLFENYFRHGLGDDPLRLAFRPLFPTLGGKPLSLQQLRRQLTRFPLIGAKKDCRLVSLLPKNIPVLDRDQPHYQLLQPFLPTVTWLDDLEFLANPKPLPAGLDALCQQIQTIDSTFRLHIHPYSDRWRELWVPFKMEKLGQHHVVVGQRHPAYSVLGNLGSHPRPEDHFEALRLILEKTTFFLHCRDAILAKYADTMTAPT